ncbi:hypothetical protein BDN67DRAFT_1005088 [Paxillus ammoniavirescens]|nr:hypothetical protein BDN67DRAFT_1005088 [Paxillus ammoniavirescens]
MSNRMDARRDHPVRKTNPKSLMASLKEQHVRLNFGTGQESSERGVVPWFLRRERRVIQGPVTRDWNVDYVAPETLVVTVEETFKSESHKNKHFAAFWKMFGLLRHGSTIFGDFDQHLMHASWGSKLTTVGTGKRYSRLFTASVRPLASWAQFILSKFG